MGTRINYEIMREDGLGPACILFSNWAGAGEDPELIFRSLAEKHAGLPTMLLIALLGYAGRFKLPAFVLDTMPGDRERVLRLTYHYDSLVSQGVATIRTFEPDGVTLIEEG